MLGALSSTGHNIHVNMLNAYNSVCYRLIYQDRVQESSPTSDSVTRSVSFEEDSVRNPRSGGPLVKTRETERRGQ